MMRDFSSRLHKKPITMSTHQLMRDSLKWSFYLFIFIIWKGLITSKIVFKAWNSCVIFIWSVLEKSVTILTPRVIIYYITFHSNLHRRCVLPGPVVDWCGIAIANMNKTVQNPYFFFFYGRGLTGLEYTQLLHKVCFSIWNVQDLCGMLIISTQHALEKKMYSSRVSLIFYHCMSMHPSRFSYTFTNSEFYRKCKRAFIAIKCWTGVMLW